MVLGVSFLWALAMLPGPIPIYGTIWALLLACGGARHTGGDPRDVRRLYEQLSCDLEECSPVHVPSLVGRPCVAHSDRAGT